MASRSWVHISLRLCFSSFWRWERHSYRLAAVANKTIKLNSKFRFARTGVVLHAITFNSFRGYYRFQEQFQRIYYLGFSQKVPGFWTSRSYTDKCLFVRRTCSTSALRFTIQLLLATWYASYTTLLFVVYVTSSSGTASRFWPCLSLRLYFSYSSRWEWPTYHLAATLDVTNNFPYAAVRALPGPSNKGDYASRKSKLSPYFPTLPLEFYKVDDTVL